MTEIIPHAALEQHIGILGKTGSGKSNLAKVIAERLLDAGGRVCVLDPTGTWWGLRLQRDGKTASKYPVVIFGGLRGDLAIAEGHGSAIAETIGGSETPAIVDTRLMTVGARTRFFADFAETLLQKNSGPLHLIIDEAHLFAPQGRVSDPQSGKMLHAANNLVSLGRGIGLRVILISQRPAKLHKDSLTQIETLVAMRLIAPQDRRAIDDWVGEWADPRQGAELVASLPSLKTGDAWIWSPELGILKREHVPLARTFDSGRPQAGEQAPALKAIDVDAVAAQLDKVAKEAVANDPARLKKRIGELERDIAGGIKAGKSESQIQSDLVAAEARGYERGRRDVIAAAAPVIKAAAELDRAIVNAGTAGAAVGDAIRRILQWSADELTSKSTTIPPAPRSRPAQSMPSKSRAGLTGAAAKMLAVLDTSPPVRRSWQQVATLAGLKARGGHFNAGRKTLLESGLIRQDGGLVSIARPSNGAPPSDHDPATLVDMWAKALTGAAPNILRYLFENGGVEDRDTIATALGLQPRGGHWNAAWKELRDNQIVEMTGNVARLTDLFRA